MKKVMIGLISLILVSCSQSEDILEINKQISYRSGILETHKFEKEKYYESESGQVFVSREEIKLVQETTSIEFKEDSFFGVIIEDVPGNVFVKGVWTYPSNLEGSKKAYTTTNVKSESNHKLVWRMRKGEFKGAYSLNIYLNDKTVKTITFNVH